MKRALLIALGIIILALLILVGTWQTKNYTAKKQGKPETSFREFIGLGKKENQSSSSNSGLSSGFSNPTTADQLAGSESAFDNFGSSIFTNSTSLAPGDNGGFINGNNPITPGNQGSDFSNNSNFNGSSSVGTGINYSSDTSNSTDSSNQNAYSSEDPITIENAQERCASEDLTLEFTDQENAQLIALKAELDGISKNLYSDADLSTENENYDSLALLLAKFNEELNYCKAQAPQLTGTEYAMRIPTPYWNDRTTDTESFFDIQATPTVTFSGNRVEGYNDPSAEALQSIDPSDTTNVGYFLFIEKLFRLNIW